MLFRSGDRRVDKGLYLGGGLVARSVGQLVVVGGNGDVHHLVGGSNSAVVYLDAGNGDVRLFGIGTGVGQFRHRGGDIIDVGDILPVAPGIADAAADIQPEGRIELVDQLHSTSGGIVGVRPGHPEDEGLGGGRVGQAGGVGLGAPELARSDIVVQIGARRDICSILLEMIERRQYSFQSRDASRIFGIPRSTCSTLLRFGVDLGFLRKEIIEGTNRQFLYTINHERNHGVRSKGLTQRQCEILTALYHTYGSGEFTTSEGAKVISCQDNTMSIHIHSFVQRGILSMRRAKPGEVYYSFATTPRKHPKCFLEESSSTAQGASPKGKQAQLPQAAVV